MFWLLSAVIFLRMIYVPLSIPSVRISKDIKMHLESAIKENCTYNDIKFIFDHRKQIKLPKVFIPRSEYYDISVDLTYVLEDMVADYFSSGTQEVAYLTRMREFIAESLEKHPFDKLNESQKVLFISLRDKAGENYYNIQSELLSISNELNSLNMTIEQYLSRANIGFIVSVIALILTITQFLLPIIRKRYQNHFEIINDSNSSQT